MCLIIVSTSLLQLQNGQQTFLGRREASLHDEVSPREQDEMTRETSDQVLVVTVRYIHSTHDHHCILCYLSFNY